MCFWILQKFLFFFYQTDHLRSVRLTMSEPGRDTGMPRLDKTLACGSARRDPISRLVLSGHDYSQLSTYVDTEKDRTCLAGGPVWFAWGGIMQHWRRKQNKRKKVSLDPYKWHGPNTTTGETTTQHELHEPNLRKCLLVFAPRDRIRMARQGQMPANSTAARYVRTTVHGASTS